jgi:type IV secretory pathway TraG/TraD family ATPase VirD4
MVLDEFPWLGMMPSFDTAFAFEGGVQLWPIIQSFTQLETSYREKWKAFVANAHVLQSFGTWDVMTADYLASRMRDTKIAVPEPDADDGVAFIENSQPVLFKKIRHKDRAFLNDKA